MPECWFRDAESSHFLRYIKISECPKIFNSIIQANWHMHIIPDIQVWRKADCEFKGKLEKLARPYLKHEMKTKRLGSSGKVLV
jgi:hypothetical protein